jgi:hypothetical protein
MFMKILLPSLTSYFAVIFEMCRSFFIFSSIFSIFPSYFHFIQNTYWSYGYLLYYLLVLFLFLNKQIFKRIFAFSSSFTFRNNSLFSFLMVSPEAFLLSYFLFHYLCLSDVSLFFLLFENFLNR